jgi:hypothetical protein
VGNDGLQIVKARLKRGTDPVATICVGRLAEAHVMVIAIVYPSAG